LTDPSDGNTETSRGENHPALDSFAVPIAKPADYTDGRKPGDWKSWYPAEARRCINNESYCLAAILVISALISGLFLGMADQSLPLPLGGGPNPPILNINFRLLMTFAVGCLGGTTFSMTAW